ncbi:MAG: DUF4367 domain-containing protein [Ruminococcaceae bacterium]|nr:DUF4367 domain-containing protein [Oscillospiraceae bacterium]
MKELHIDRFDTLISLAAADCVKEEASAFSGQDVSGIERDPRVLRRILGRSRKSRWKTVKLILLVALLCMSVAFTACMLVPEIRHAVWNVLIKNHGDHIEIGFDTDVETEAPTEPPAENYPETIEKKMALTYVPEGCVKGDDVTTSMQHQIFYYTDSGDWKFFATQSTITESNTFVDDESGQVAYIEVNGFKAVLVEYFEGESLYSLTWQDEHYRFTVYGVFSSMNEIVKIGEGISVIE